MNLRACLTAGLLFANVARAGDAVDYASRVKPVLAARCYPCHGALKQQGGLRLDTAAQAIRGGKNGAAVIPGDPEGSPLLDRVSADEGPDRMPPEGEPLKPEEVRALRDWVAQGATAPADERPERGPNDHWAFRAPVRPPVPVVANSAWARNPIDAFLAARHENHQLEPQRPASKRAWLRRVTFDLVGLPPTPAEARAFLADETPGAEERVVSRLLASPQYGERWGRHWMDVWRYSDWWGLGAEVRNSQKHLWHWRDWVVESLNADKPYDAMLREMLAADELYPNHLDRLRASGFLARQYFKFNRTTWLDETVEHTAKAMLGLTFNCAKCHDHKYDPFSQADYYRFRALFEPYQVRTDAIPGVTDFEKDGIPRAFDCNLDAPTFLHVRGDDRNPDRSRPLAPGFPAFLGPNAARIEPVALPPEAFQPGLRPFVLETHRKAAGERVAAARATLRAVGGPEKSVSRLVEAAASAGAPSLRDAAEWSVARHALAAAEAGSLCLEARAAADRARFGRAPAGDAGSCMAGAVRAERAAALASAEEAVARAAQEALSAVPEKKPEADKKFAAARSALDLARKAANAPTGTYTPLVGASKAAESNLETEESRLKPFPTTSTGRRSALAAWLTGAENPLPARVAVNHIWARHFGRALVPTVFDFGRKGAPPTHPELLDWLAVEFTQNGWSMKHMHRLMVLSNAYRTTSSSAGASAATLAADPDNREYWRGNPLRLESEAVRDALLHLAGEVDLTLGGPPVPAAQEGSRRRSLYFVHSHNEHPTFLATFDGASVLECYRRAESIVPQQALALENSPLATAAAGQIARRIEREAPGLSDGEFVREAFRTVLSVEPTGPEQAEALQALGLLTAAARRRGLPGPESRARTHLVQAFVNHNDFITVR